jgi:hypothetical protein
MKIRVLIVWALVASGPTLAADNLFLTGAESSRLGDYAYAGMLMPLGNSSLGSGWVMRHWVDRVSYNYVTRGQRVDAVSYGYSPAIGYQAPLGRSHLGLSGALRLGNTRLSPDDPSNDDRGTRARFALEAEITTPLGRSVENQLIVNTQLGNGGYFARERLLVRGFGDLFAGPELIVKGSREHSGWQTGLAVGGISLGRTKLLLRGGVGGQRNETTEAYAGAEIALNFGVK